MNVRDLSLKYQVIRVLYYSYYRIVYLECPESFLEDLGVLTVKCEYIDFLKILLEHASWTPENKKELQTLQLQGLSGKRLSVIYEK